MDVRAPAEHVQDVAGPVHESAPQDEEVERHRGDRVGGALAVQLGSELCGWARPGRRRWANGGHPLGAQGRREIYNSLKVGSLPASGVI